jgi:hypothetical protein
MISPLWKVPETIIPLPHINNGRDITKRLRLTNRTLHSAHAGNLCVAYGSRNKQRLCPQTAVTGWALQRRCSVFVVLFTLRVLTLGLACSMPGCWLEVSLQAEVLRLANRVKLFRAFPSFYSFLYTVCRMLFIQSQSFHISQIWSRKLLHCHAASHLRSLCREEGGIKFLRNVSNETKEYTPSDPRRLSCLEDGSIRFLVIVDSNV